MWVLLAEQPVESMGPWAAGCRVVGNGGCSMGVGDAAEQVCHCNLVLGRLDACAWLQWGSLPVLHHCLLKLILGKGCCCFQRDGLSFQPYFLLLMVVITRSFLSWSIHAYIHT